ncbi:MAG: TIGR01777 family oxidoreductase [Bacteroidota bacterium]
MATILIGGGSGFVGGFLSQALAEQGHEVLHLSRKARPDAPYKTYRWDVATGTIDEAAVTRADYIFNLAGAGIADQRWTPKRKQLIISSRTESTRLIAKTLQQTGHRPKQYLSASAIGFYGDRGEEAVDENSPAGTGFLAESTQAWEESVESIKALGIPTFINRTGIVLHPSGGAMEKMVLPLNFFTSTYFGDGQQWYSWIHMDDIVGIFCYAMEHQLTGVYNGVAPHPVRNKTLAAELPKAKGRFAAVLPAPAFTLKTVFGEMSATILGSSKVSAAKIIDAGYTFKFPTLPAALKDLL